MQTEASDCGSGNKVQNKVDGAKQKAMLQPPACFEGR